MKILFVCRGNVARSQIAEVLLKNRAGNSFIVTSAGTKLSGPEEPLENLRPALNEVLDVMREIDIDISQNIRKQITEEMVQDVDKIILVVDENDPIPDFLKNSPKIVANWHVLDPKGKDLDFTRNVRKQISDLVDKFILENK
jgi:ArsR family transcriptional regulator